MAILTGVSFALSFVLARKIESEATPIFQNAIRSIVGFITFFFICLSFGILLQTFSLPLMLVLILVTSISFTVILGDTAYLVSQKILGPAKALAITTTTPFFTILFAILFLNRPISVHMIFSGILIAIGVIIITKGEKDDLNNKESNENELNNRVLPKMVKGTLWALFTAISWAIGIALTDFSINQVDHILNLGVLSTMIAMMVRFLFASVSLSLIASIESTRKAIPKNRNTWIILIASAVLSYSIGSIFFGEAVHIAGAVFMSLISTAMPLFTIPFSYLINKEKISKKGFLGVGLTLIGVILILF
ncbi:MAG: DMT family transporter [Promethearchaeota archaeon]|nr:MAG: DMT family transporter [Candidatus Lokiarchaeota archaeon]